MKARAIFQTCAVMCDFLGLLDVYVLGQDNKTMIDEIMFNKTKTKVGTNNNNLPGKST